MINDTDDTTAPDSVPTSDKDPVEIQLAAKVMERITKDSAYHKSAFDRMRIDMAMARRGATKSWPKDHYVVNLVNRHLNAKTAALYAKDPEAFARRRERMDFELWDESPETLMAAMEVLKMAGSLPMDIDPMTGQPILPPEAQQAQRLVQDVIQGSEVRRKISKTGETLRSLFNFFMSSLQPLDVKSAMKASVRRACTTGVAFVELGFERSYQRDPTIQASLSDAESRLARVERMLEDAKSADTEMDDTEVYELRASIESLSQQDMKLDREGLVFDFPESTRVIPDSLCTSLVGFIGARWLTIEYRYDPETFKDVFKIDPPHMEQDTDSVARNGVMERPQEIKVYKHFDKAQGLVYFVCENHAGFLRPPSKPDVRVDGFWTVFAVTFNAVEDPDDSVFPPSDVTLMEDQVMDYNRSRQGQREHRKAARPRYVTPSGFLNDESKAALANAEAFEVVEVNVGIDAKIDSLIQLVPMKGVDPNLYETNTIFTDIQMSVGAHENQFGGTSGATATESSIAEGSRVSSLASNTDDLDSFLTRIARAAGQILLAEMSLETVREIVGPGAVWPELSADQISKELYLDVKAGSSGRPNRAVEVKNWQMMLPYLMQLPGISPTWLARQTLNRLDDKLDLTEAIVQGVASVVAQNQMSSAQANGAGEGPGADPNMQGGNGGSNAPKPQELQAGTDAPMGNNQV
jgi:hypothetical protein